MTPRQANLFKRTLELKRGELQLAISKRLEPLVIEHTGDDADQARYIAERDVAARSLDQMYDLLRLVENALDEIGTGTFGVCAQCGDDIPQKRLRAVPWSPYCISCQEHSEGRDRDLDRTIGSLPAPGEIVSNV